MKKLMCKLKCIYLGTQRPYLDFRITLVACPTVHCAVPSALVKNFTPPPPPPPQPVTILLVTMININNRLIYTE